MTIPNLIAGLRLIAAPGMLWLALQDRSVLVLGLFLVLSGSDWLDGKLAVWLDQRSALGARLDTIADVVMYGILLIALGILYGEEFLAEWPWIAPAIAGHAISWSLSLLKFRTLPSYHAWTAKISWALTLIAVVALLGFAELLPLRVAAVAVTVANLEAILITLRIESPEVDVRSVLELPKREG